MTSAILLVALAAMTHECAADCAHWYRPTTSRILYNSSYMTFTFDEAMALCQTELPGYGLPVTLQLSVEERKQCKGDYPVSMKRDPNGNKITWFTSDHQDPTVLVPMMEISDDDHIALNGTLGRSNSITGRWDLVSNISAFSCVICQRLPINSFGKYLGPLTPPSYELLVYNGGDDNIAYLQSIADVMGVEVTGVRCAPTGLNLVYKCWALNQTPLNDTVQWALGVDLGGGVKARMAAPVPNSERCGESFQDGVIWPRINQGLAHVHRHVSGVLMTRACLPDVSRLNGSVYSDVEYWEAMWQPCAHPSNIPPPSHNYSSRTASFNSIQQEIVSTCYNPILPIPSQQIEQFAENVNNLFNFAAGLELNDVDTISPMNATLRCVMATATDSRVHLTTLSNAGFLVADVDTFPIAVHALGMDLHVVNDTEIVPEEDSVNGTRVVISFPKSITRLKPRISMIFINDEVKVFGCFYEKASNWQSFVFAVTVTDVNNSLVFTEDTVKISLRKKVPLTDHWYCEFWSFSNDLYDAVCNMADHADQEVTECVCTLRRGASRPADFPSGVYVLRQTRDYEVLWAHKGYLVIFVFMGMIAYYVYCKGCRCRFWKWKEWRTVKRKWLLFNEKYRGRYERDTELVPNEVVQPDR